MTHPLEGVRVVEVSTSVAGPYAGLILGALGADVVKIEPPGGDDARAWGPPFWEGESAMFLAMNASKRSIVLDLKAQSDREHLLELVRKADVFLQNLRAGVAERLGIGFEELRKVNARLVYCTIGAFGNVGPRRADPGYDPLMQAAGGVMSVTGEPNGPPVRSGASIVDQGSAMWAVIGILAALRRRDRGSQLVETSLYETAVNWVPSQVVGYLASGRSPGRHGSAHPLIAPYEAFETADGMLMLAVANDRQYVALREALGLPDDPRLSSNPDRVAHRRKVRELIAPVMATRTTADWLERLASMGVPAAPVQDIADVVSDPQTAALELLQPLEHSTIKGLQVVALPVSIEGERMLHRGPPPLLGEPIHYLGTTQERDVGAAS